MAKSKKIDEPKVCVGFSDGEETKCVAVVEDLKPTTKMVDCWSLKEPLTIEALVDVFPEAMEVMGSDRGTRQFLLAVRKRVMDNVRSRDCERVQTANLRWVIDPEKPLRAAKLYLANELLFKMSDVLNNPDWTLQQLKEALANLVFKEKR